MKHKKKKKKKKKKNVHVVGFKSPTTRIRGELAYENKVNAKLIVISF